MTTPYPWWRPLTYHTPTHHSVCESSEVSPDLLLDLHLCPDLGVLLSLDVVVLLCLFELLPQQVHGQQLLLVTTRHLGDVSLLGRDFCLECLDLPLVAVQVLLQSLLQRSLHLIGRMDHTTLLLLPVWRRRSLSPFLPTLSLSLSLSLSPLPIHLWV